MKNRIFIYSFLLLLYPIISFAISNDILIKSAEKIVSDWEKLLSKDHLFASGEYDCWGVYRSTISGPLSYDIQKTDSIVSPYILIISGKVQWDQNLSSQHADKYSEVENENFGFTTKEKALAHITEKDFGIDTQRVYNLKIIYSYQKGSWVLKKFNSLFIEFLGENSSKNIKEAIPDLEKYKVE